MPKTRKKRWSKILQPDGGRRIRMFERDGSEALWYSVMENGRKVRKSLETSDRTEAETRATTIAMELAKADPANVTVLTVGQPRGALTRARSGWRRA